MNTKRIHILMAVGALLMGSSAVIAQQTASMPIYQTFDQGIPSDWEFSCNRSLITEGSGSALRIWGGGHAIIPVQPQDFVLSFRYRTMGGSGDIGFNFHDGASIDVLVVEPRRLTLSRRTSLQANQFSHQDFDAAPVLLDDGRWHDFVLQYRNGRLDVWVDRVPTIGHQYTSLLPRGGIGLGVIANSGTVDYDNVSYGPATGAVTPPVSTTVPGTTGAVTAVPRTTTYAIPGTTTTGQPAQLMVSQPAPGGQITIAQTDLAVTDVYATRLRNGQLFVAITNRGPQAVTQQPIELQMNINGALSHYKSTITLPVGHTATWQTGTINTASANAPVRATLTVPGLYDPEPDNNDYYETLPQAPSPDAQATDLVLSDIWTTKKIQGQVGLAVTNRGPVEATGRVEFLINVNGQQKPLEQYVVQLKPNETRQIYTNVTIDASEGDQTITATVRRPGIHDRDQTNNTHQETVAQVAGSGGEPSQHDLAVTDIALVEIAPKWMTIKVQVTNRGTVPVVNRDITLSVEVTNSVPFTVGKTLSIEPNQSIMIDTGSSVYPENLPVTIKVDLDVPGVPDADNTYTEQFSN